MLSGAALLRIPAFMVRICLLLALLCLPGAVKAACPSGAATLFVPGPEKSQIYRIFEPLRAAWSERFGSAITPERLPGRGGSYALSRLKDARADGCVYAGLVMPTALLVAGAPDGMYKSDDITPVFIFAGAANALWVDESGPFVSLSDLLRYARAEAERPDGRFTVAGTGSYTDQHLAQLVFNREAGVKSLYIPVLGSGAAADAVKRKEASACWAYAMNREYMPGMRPVAVAAAQRSPALPDVPTFRELELEILSEAFFGLAVSSATSRDARQRIEKDLSALSDDARLRRELSALGLIPAFTADLPAFMARQRRETAQALEDYALLPRRGSFPAP